MLSRATIILEVDRSKPNFYRKLSVINVCWGFLITKSTEIENGRQSYPSSEPTHRHCHKAKDEETKPTGSKNY
jgi:hypothetical protein